MRKIRKLCCLMIKAVTLGTFPGCIFSHRLTGAQLTPGQFMILYSLLFPFALSGQQFRLHCPLHSLCPHQLSAVQSSPGPALSKCSGLHQFLGVMWKNRQTMVVLRVVSSSHKNSFPWREPPRLRCAHVYWTSFLLTDDAFFVLFPYLSQSDYLPLSFSETLHHPLWPFLLSVHKCFNFILLQFF